MNLEARKIAFIQDFLKIKNEDVISRLEKIMIEEKNVSNDQIFMPMTQEELNNHIDQSESDFLNKRFKNSRELLSINKTL
jgi:hypothetical protein